jgi:ABC-type Na+ transport system ATPase subunit NatA
MSCLGDRKILIDESILNGALDFPKYSQAFAEIIITKSKPKFTIGIFGDWGTGKTTLMLMIKNLLEGKEKIKQV